MTEDAPDVTYAAALDAVGRGSRAEIIDGKEGPPAEVDIVVTGSGSEGGAQREHAQTRRARGKFPLSRQIPFRLDRDRPGLVHCTDQDSAMTGVPA